MTQAALIWCPFPNLPEAQAATRTLISEGLIACANIIPQVHAIFVWQGDIEEAQEVVMLAKTTADLLENAIARLAVLHSYDTPAITGWIADKAAPHTLGWLGQNLTAGVK